MSADDLERVKRDLATLKLAIADDLPFKPTTVRFAFALALGGAISLIWAFHPYPVPPKWDVVIPALLQVLPILVTFVHFAVTHRRSHCSVSPAEMKRAHMNYHPYIIVALAAPFLIVARRAGWVPQSFVEPAFLFFFGAAIMAAGLTERRQRVNLGLSVPMLVFSVAGLIFHWEHALLSGLIFSTAGLAVALIMIVQLRRQAQNNAAH